MITPQKDALLRFFNIALDVLLYSGWKSYHLTLRACKNENSLFGRECYFLIMDPNPKQWTKRSKPMQPIHTHTYMRMIFYKRDRFACNSSRVAILV